jgi:predicted nucleic acid-binding protein
VTLLVIDASVAIKWVVEEEGTSEALALRGRAKLIAPDLLVAECANILWKKVARRELLKNEALVAAALLETADIELYPMRSFLAAATKLAIEMDHPAYDCLYLVAALENGCRMATADERLLRKVREGRRGALRDRAISLTQAATLRGAN